MHLNTIAKFSTNEDINESDFGTDINNTYNDMVVRENQIGIETNEDYATRSELLPLENDEKKLGKKKTLFEQVIDQIRKNPTNVFKKVNAASDPA